MENRIGFVGCYSHDLILMLAKIFCCLDKKVLIWDRNKQHTLQTSIPVPEGLCAEKEGIEYDGFFFTKKECDLSLKEDYDIEIIDFGMDTRREEIRKCTGLVIVTDMLLHHIHRLVAERLPKDKLTVCIFRDAFEEICERETEMKKFLQTFPNRREFYLLPDYRDVRNRYVCETLHEYNINRASKDMQEMIYKLVALFCPEYTEKEIRRKIRLKERRRYR